MNNDTPFVHFALKVGISCPLTMKNVLAIKFSATMCKQREYKRIEM